MKRWGIQILGYGVIAALVVVLAGVAGYGPLQNLKKEDAPETTSAAATDGKEKPKSNTSTTFGNLQSRSYERGDCVEWDDDERGQARTTTVIPCTESHLIQIAGKASAQQFKKYPTSAQWNGFYRAKCQPLVESLMGTKLDPDGRFHAGAIIPIPESWEVGSRDVWCGAVAMSDRPPKIKDEFVRFHGSVVGASQQYLRGVGTCWDRNQPYATSCRGPHDWEIAGYTEFDDTPPPDVSDSRAWEFRAVGCANVAHAYMGRGLAPNEKWGWLPVQRASWETGARKLTCIVQRVNNGQPIRSTGSLKG